MSTSVLLACSVGTAEALRGFVSDILSGVIPRTTYLLANRLFLQVNNQISLQTTSTVC